MYEARAVLFSSRHLSRKAARIDAKIDERVNDGSADERGDDNYQHFQAEGTHTGSPPSKRRYRSKAAIPRKHAAAQRGGRAGRYFRSWLPMCWAAPAISAALWKLFDLAKAVNDDGNLPASDRLVGHDLSGCHFADLRISSCLELGYSFLTG